MAYQEQYSRALRWYERFRVVHQGRVHNVASDNYLDEIHAFFQNCYHLKDWIKNDSSAPAAMREGVEQFVTQTTSLAICADLCNSLKHFILKQPPRSGSAPTVGPKKWSLQLSGSNATIALRFEIESGGRMLDAFQIATEAMSEWATYINNHGGSVQQP